MDFFVAFAVTLVLIYMLIVAEFGNFMLPVVVMAPIPLALIGSLVGHALLGAEFTAFSGLGVIILAGIVVRSSVLIVDFAQAKVLEGMEVREAVIVAAETRMRPIILTALGLIAVASVLYSDPLLRGMSIPSPLVL